MLNGQHYIAGEWLNGPDVFQADNPSTGEKLPTKFQHGTEELVDQAVQAANACAEEFAAMLPAKRAAFLRAIADEIDARGDEITEIGNLESALPAARLTGERGRTVGQLRFFADWIEEGSWFEARIETAQPDRQPLPKPDIRVMHKALGPVGVFGASNFPLAFRLRAVTPHRHWPPVARSCSRAMLPTPARPKSLPRPSKPRLKKPACPKACSA